MDTDLKFRQIFALLCCSVWVNSNINKEYLERIKIVESATVLVFEKANNYFDKFKKFLFCLFFNLLQINQRGQIVIFLYSHESTLSSF